MNNITQEQKARIFSLYMGCETIAPDPDDDSQQRRGRITGYHGEYGPEVQFDYGHYAAEEPAYPDFPEVGKVKLLLRPLSAITDEDAIEVAELYYGGKRYRNEILIEDGRRFVKYGDWCSNGKDWFFFSMFQYLIQQGYAVSLFIAPGHPDNGKDAIELGLAIDSTLTAQP